LEDRQLLSTAPAPWTGYQPLTSSPNGNFANTAWNENPGYKVTAKYTTNFIKPTKQWNACCTVTLYEDGRVAPTATFDSANSWVVTSDENSPGLWGHEQLHLVIAQYVAQQAGAHLTSILKGLPKDKHLEGFGCAQDASEAAAKAAAFQAACDDLKSKWGFPAAEQAADDAYDAATSHGTNAAQQANWAANWQALTNAAISQSLGG